MGDLALTNYMNNCSYVGGRRVKFYLKADLENAGKDLVYILSVSGIPTPFIPTTGGNLIQIQLTDASNIATYSTNPGHYNTTTP